MHTEVMLLKLRHQRERERERWLPSVTFGQSKSCVQCKDASKVCGARKDDGHKTMLYFIVMYRVSQKKGTKRKDDGHKTTLYFIVM